MSLRTRIGACVLLLLALLLPARLGVWHDAPLAHAAGTTLSHTYSASADTYVDQSNPNTNFATVPYLQVNGAPIQNSYLLFDVTSLTGTVVRAALRVYVETTQTAGYQVHALSNTTWTDTAVTYANAPAFNPAVAGSSGNVVGGTWTEVDITPLVTSVGKVALVLTSTGAPLVLGSAESGYAPQLIVDETAASGAPVLMAAGDISCEPNDPYFNNGTGTATHCNQARTAAVFAKESPSAILTLGDNQYQANSTNYNSVFNSTWGVYKALIHPVPGNHEYYDINAFGYFSYFGHDFGTYTTGYYSYDLGSWHIIALNAECAYIGGCAPGSPEETWLRNDLSTHSNLCTLVYWHQPRWSDGEHGSDPTYDAFWQDLYNAKVDVVLNGHDHDYERFAPQNTLGQIDPTNGVREFVVGTGGKSHYAFLTTLPTSVTRSWNTFGVLKLTLHSTSYDWEFIPEDTTNSYTDFGSGACH